MDNFSRNEEKLPIIEKISIFGPEEIGLLSGSIAVLN